MGEILSIFGINWKLLLVQGFNFGVLLIILWYLLYRPVMNMLEKRQAAIAEGVLNAKRAEKELADLSKQKEAIISEATKDASIIMERAKERALSKEETILREAQVRSERLLKEAEQKAREEKRKTLEAAKEEIARMVVLGAQKVLSTSQR